MNVSGIPAGFPVTRAEIDEASGHPGLKQKRPRVRTRQGTTPSIEPPKSTTRLMSIFQIPTPLHFQLIIISLSLSMAGDYESGPSQKTTNLFSIFSVGFL